MMEVDTVPLLLVIFRVLAYWFSKNQIYDQFLIQIPAETLFPRKIAYIPHLECGNIVVIIPDRLIAQSIHHPVLLVRFCGPRTLEAERGDSL